MLSYLISFFGLIKLSYVVRLFLEFKSFAKRQTRRNSCIRSQKTGICQPSLILSQTLIVRLQQIRQMSKKQVLQINYKQDYGLILGWRYTDLSNYQTFFRHVFVLFTDNRVNANRFLKLYLKRLRPGDLYTILYYNSESKLRQTNWKEKMVFHQDQRYSSILRRSILLGDKEGMMAKVEEQFGQFSEPIVVNIYMDTLQEKEWFHHRVRKQRANQKYDFIVAMFGPFTSTCLTFSNEVSTIPIHPKDNNDTVHFFLSHVYQAAVLWARVTIESSNGQINNTSQNNWRSINFNTIERIYRGPSIKYDKDFLLFYGYKFKQLKYNLVIRLTFVTLQKRKYVSEKQFSVQSYGGFYQKTFSTTNWIKPYHAYGEVWLQDNPFRTLTIVKFEPDEHSVK